MSLPLPKVPASPRGWARFLGRSAAFCSALTAGRRTRADARSAAPRTPDQALADLSAAAHSLPAELPGLIGALAMRGAVFGAHDVQVAA